ncbi:MAG: hypothetical protein RIR26_154 [Pseudomonadota bacterium]
MVARHQTHFEEKNAFLLYHDGGHLFGTPLSQVKEVIPFRQPRKLPNTPDGYLGVMSLRGEVIGVVALSYWFPSLKAEQQSVLMQSMIIAHGISGETLAVVVDTIDGVALAESNEVVPPVSISPALAHGAGHGAAKFAQGVATLIDLRQLCASMDASLQSKSALAG